MDTHEAIRKAKSAGLDLVEVSSNARPPVCKIVDYGKYKYDQKKLKKDQPKKTHRLKEVKFRPGIGSNDYNMKVTRAESFLMDEDKETRDFFKVDKNMKPGTLHGRCLPGRQTTWRNLTLTRFNSGGE